MQGLEYLREEWGELRDRMAASDVHGSWAYYQALLKARDNRAGRLYFASVRTPELRLVALIPLELQQRRIARMRMSAWGAPIDPDRPSYEALIEPGVPIHAVADAVRVALIETRPDVRIFALDKVEFSAAALALGRALGKSVVRPVGELLRIPTDLPMDELLARCGKKHRSNLRRGYRDVSRAGPVALGIAASEKEVVDAFENFLRLEASGWKGNNQEGNALALRSKACATARILLTELGKAAACEVYSLRAGNECIASLILFLGRSEAYLFKTAYNESWSNSSPGHLLLEMTLAHCLQYNDRQAVNLGWEAEWSKPWRPRTSSLYSIHASLSRWKGNSVIALLQLSDRVRGAAPNPPSHV